MSSQREEKLCGVYNFADCGSSVAEAESFLFGPTRVTHTVCDETPGVNTPPPEDGDKLTGFDLVDSQKEIFNLAYSDMRQIDMADAGHQARVSDFRFV